MRNVDPNSKDLKKIGTKSSALAKSWIRYDVDKNCKDMRVAIEILGYNRRFFPK